MSFLDDAQSAAEEAAQQTENPSQGETSPESLSSGSQSSLVPGGVSEDITPNSQEPIDDMAREGIEIIPGGETHDK